MKQKTEREKLEFEIDIIKLTAIQILAQLKMPVSAEMKEFFVNKCKKYGLNENKEDKI